MQYNSSSSGTIIWHAWGYGNSFTFEIERTFSSNSSNVLTESANPQNMIRWASTSEYTFGSSGQGDINTGVSTDTYTLEGEATDHYGFRASVDVGSPGQSSSPSGNVEVGLKKDRKLTIDQAGGSQATPRSESVSSGSNIYDLTIASEGSDGKMRLAVTYSDDFTLKHTSGNGATGTQDGTYLDAGGTERYNVTFSDGAGSPPAPGNSEAQLSQQQAGPPGGGQTSTIDETHAWQVGYDWLLGSNPPGITFYNHTSKWTQDLAKHRGIAWAREDAILWLETGADIEGEKKGLEFSLGGWNSWTYVSDGVHVVTSPVLGLIAPEYYSTTLNQAFLGSYNGTWHLTHIDRVNRTAIISFHVHNETSWESATRIPGLGYLTGSRYKSLLPKSAGNVTKQVFEWAEVIRW